MDLSEKRDPPNFMVSLPINMAHLCYPPISDRSKSDVFFLISPNSHPNSHLVVSHSCAISQTRTNVMQQVGYPTPILSHPCLVIDVPICWQLKIPGGIAGDFLLALLSHLASQWPFPDKGWVDLKVTRKKYIGQFMSPIHVTIGRSGLKDWVGF